MSTRLFIGIITFFILAQVICNFVEGNSFLTGANVADIQAATNHTYTTTASSSGTGVSFVDKTVDFFDKLLFFDYSIFKDVDYSTTEAACAAIGGEWDSTISACKTANDFAILRYMFIAIGLVMWIELAIVFKNLLSL